MNPKVKVSTPILAAAFFSLFLVVFQTSLLGNLVIYNESLMEHGTIQSGYGKNMTEEFQKQWQELLEKKGIGEDFAAQYVDSRILYTTFLNGLTWQENVIQENVAEFQSTIYHQLQAYLKSHGVTEEKVRNQAAESLAKEASVIYQTNVFPTMVYRFKTVAERRQPILWTMMGMSFCCIVCSCLYITKTVKNVDSVFQLMQQAVITSMPAFFLFLCAIYYKINALYNRTQGGLNSKMIRIFQRRLIITGIIFVVLDIMILLLLGMKRKKLREQ